MTGNGLVQELWNYCNILRDDGPSHGDYVEQLTYLLFLKMADEQTQAPFSRPSIIPDGLGWQSLTDRDGDELEVQYRHVLTELGRQPDHIAASLTIGTDDFDYVPFSEQGGLGKAFDLFGDDLGVVMEELNGVLVA